MQENLFDLTYSPEVYTSSMNYGYKKRTTQNYEEAIESVKSELAKEGFGVLTEINVKATLKKKLDIDYDNYIILGACNPQFAHKALKSDQDIGLLLPCNVIIYEKESRVVINAILPTVALGISGDSSLEKIAGQVEDKLKRVVDQAVKG